eukprot:8276728-Ditylum_brightwellii.AAC.1
MKPKPNEIKWARLTARGYEQQDRLHYHSHNLSAPVVNDMKIRMVMTMIIMTGWDTCLLDVNGAFLNRRFQNGDKLYTPVPQGFEPFYPADVLLLFLRTLYRLKQAAMQFWRELQKAFRYMRYWQNGSNPCLAFRWVNGFL